jgi:hypothetical protein
VSHEELGPVLDEWADVLAPARTTVAERPGDTYRLTATSMPGRPDRTVGRDRENDGGWDGGGRAGTAGVPPRGGWTRRRRAAALLAALVLGSGVGRLGSGVWDSTQDEQNTQRGPSAAAVVIDVRPSSGTAVRIGADLVVRISNLGRSLLTLNGAEASFDAGEITTVTPPGLQVPPGASAIAVLHSAIACGSPQPLRLPPVQLRGGDGVLRSVTVDGSAAALALVCELQPPAVHLIELMNTSVDGARLRLQVNSPTGRTTQVTGISAGGVPLSGRPIPGTVDALGRTIWLDPPTSCAQEWLLGGLPRTVDLRLDSGGDSTVTLDLGFALARWLRAGACSGAHR